jgi:hypothetical protein
MEQVKQCQHMALYEKPQDRSALGIVGWRISIAKSVPNTACYFIHVWVNVYSSFIYLLSKFYVEI